MLLELRCDRGEIQLWLGSEGQLNLQGLLAEGCEVKDQGLDQCTSALQP